MEQSITVIIDSPSKEIEVIMPKEETIELRHIRNTIGEREDLPSLNARSSLTSRVRSLMAKFFGVPQLIHLQGSYEVNKTLTLNAGQDNVYSTYSDGTYLYVGTYTSPGQIIKIDLSTFTISSSLILDSGENNVMSLTSNGTYLYAGLITTPGKIVKINLSNFTKDSTLTLDAGENEVRALASDGSFLYAGLWLQPGKIVKIDISTFTKTSTITLAAGSDYVKSLFLDGFYLYAALQCSPGKIIKINIYMGTFTNTSTLTLATNNTTSLFSDGIYLYAGTSNIAFTSYIYKIDLRTFTVTDKLDPQSYAVESLFSDGTYLYACLSAPFTYGFCTVDIVTFKILGLLNFANVEYSMFTDGTYIYTVATTSPTIITRRYIISFADSHQRKIDTTKECIQSVISATTSLGLATTLVDTARTESNDYWNNMTVLILGGDYKGQSRRISDFDAASDTITVSPAFNGAIASGVRYAILPDVALTQSDVLSDATPFAGADIAIIKGYTDNLVASITFGTYSHSNDTNENDVLTFTASTQDINVYLDMVNITQISTIREYIEIDSLNYRQLSEKVYPSDFDTSTKAISLSFKQPNINYKITLQSSVIEGSAKDISYAIRARDLQ